MKHLKKIKKILACMGLLLAIPLLLVALCFWAVQPVDIENDGATQFGLSVHGEIWLPLAAVPTEKVVAVEVNEQYVQFLTEEPNDIREETRKETEDLMSAQYEAQIKELEAQIDTVNAALEEANAALEQRKAQQEAAARRASEQKAAARSAGQEARAQISDTQQSVTGTGSTEVSLPTQAAEQPAPVQPGVDAAVLISNGHAYASQKNMGINSSLSIGNAGYFNPVDTSVLTQDAAQSDIYYCIDKIAGMMGSVDQDHPPVYNIVQSGSLIYVLYG